jgi:DNA-directed RNA polymerase subunit beta
MESFVDINQQLVYKTAEQLLKNFPIENASKKLELLNDLEVDVNKDIYSDIPGQKETKIKRKSWSIPLKGTVRLTDKKTGQVISEKKIKLVEIPVMTNRYSFIIDGNEYSSMYQWRLKPGVYTRLTKDGFYESTFNLALAKLTLRLDPQSLLFYLNVNGTSEKFYLYPILRTYGIIDSEMEKMWGKSIFDKNRAIGLTYEAQTLIGLAKKVARIDPSRTTSLTLDEARDLILKYFAGTHLDESVVSTNIGVKSDKINPEVLLSTSKKLLSVMRGEDTEDERDSLAYKDLYNVADRVEYYLERNLKPVKKKIEYKMRNKTDVGEILTQDIFPKAYKNAFLKDDLNSPSPQTNPMEMLLEARKTTVMGPGGIQSRHAITEDVRNIHPSHIGILDPLQTPEGQKVGVTVPLSVYTQKEGKNIKTAYVRPDGMEVFLSPMEVFNMTIGFPGQYKMVNGKLVPKGEKIKGYRKGQPGMYPATEVDAYLKGAYQLWSLGSSVVPFLNSNSGNRAAMAGRQMTQAVQLEQPESPLVLVKDPVSGKPWNEVFGNSLNVRPPASFTSGEVTKIDDDYIYVKEDNTKKQIKIGLYNNFPLNQESFLQSTPLVKVGAKVNKSTIFARNNFQDKNLALALGKNVNVAYMPWKGLNVEDATVVTESAAHKLFVSESIQRETLVYDNKAILSLNKFRSLFPEKVDASKLELYDSDGVIKKGSRVEKDDFIIIAAREKEFTPEQLALNKLSKRLSKPYTDISIRWEFDEPGEVIYVNKGSKRIDVHIKMKSPLRVGDKLAGQWGNKMIVSKIIPDHEAPHTADGRRADLIMHPFGVIGRTNIGQLLATAAGKIAQKTGQSYHITNFENDSNIDKVLSDLKSNGVEPDEVMTDGKDGRPFERKIFFGPQYIMKLKHMVDHKIKTRSFGSYDINEQVVKGKDGGQSIDPLQWYALVAHGLKQNLAETTKYLNVKNDEFWRAIQLNLPIPKPNRNFVWDKFETYLKGVGIDLKRDGNTIKMLPMTDQGVLELSGGAVSDPKFIAGKNLAEIKGGLFDPEITGGLSGTKFAHMELVEKIPNPIYEETIQKLMGVTKDKYKAMITDGTVGPEVLKFLENLNVDSKLDELGDKIKKAKKPEIPKLNYQIRVLRNLKTMGLNPVDAYMMKYMPIIPPKFRPIYPLPNGDLNASPINYHYRDVGLINQQLGKMLELGIDTKDVRLAKSKLYQSVKAAQGLGDPVTYDNTKEGLIKTLAGEDPSSGLFKVRCGGKEEIYLVLQLLLLILI